MRNLLIQDEINRLLFSSQTPTNASSKVGDEILDLLVEAYVYGFRDVTDVLKSKAEITEDNIKRAIEREIDGRTVNERIAEWSREGDVNGLARVAITESHRIYNEAGYDAAVASKATKKRWHTQLDDKVRDSHDYLEGIVKGMDEPFYTFLGNKAMFPGAFGVAEEDINCRCYLTYEL